MSSPCVRYESSYSSSESQENRQRPIYRQPSWSAAASSQSVVSRSCESSCNSSDWRRHSSAKPARRVSDTQICSGRRPGFPQCRAMLLRARRCTCSHENLQRTALHKTHGNRGLHATNQGRRLNRWRLIVMHRWRGHPPRGHDDLANAACGALWLASRRRCEVDMSGAEMASPEDAQEAVDEYMRRLDSESANAPWWR